MKKKEIPEKSMVEYIEETSQFQCKRVGWQNNYAKISLRLRIKNGTYALCPIYMKKYE